ncbi:hypothetical protein [Blastococcus sp. TF02-8]|uniref:hypothetical protein n=1 Tax=Blastococcus sp. TF02-8 TaxID=2250574 RepID=UPI0011BFAC15|nr:hypothetical protein [Blastococcus sp. TF02-8]
MALATMFAAVQLGWIPPSQARVAAFTAIVATVPLQTLACVLGLLTRDPVAATGMGVLSGTWAVIGLTTLTSPPGAVSAGLGVLLLTAGLALLVPSAAAVGSKLVPAAVMGLASVRFLVTGGYELTNAAGWKAAAGWVGLALAVLAIYAALALELEGGQKRTILPVGRRGAGAAAMGGVDPNPADLAREAGVAHSCEKVGGRPC